MPDVADLPNLVETEITNGTRTIINCKVGNWSDWRQIYDTQQVRSRQIIVAPSAGGKQCPDLIEKRQTEGISEFIFDVIYLNLEIYQN